MKSRRLVSPGLILSALFALMILVPLSTVHADATSRITVGEGPYYSALVGTNLYTSNQCGNTVSVIDTKTNTVTATIPVGAGPYWLARVF